MRYIPDPSLANPSVLELNEWLARELARIREAIETARDVEFQNVAPAKPREGMIAAADGTNWNPGAGKGVYAYYSGAWNKLG